MRNKSEKAWLSQSRGSMDTYRFIIHFAMCLMCIVQSATGAHRRGN